MTVSEDGDSVEVTVHGGAGEEVHLAADDQGVPLPADFPKDVPVYPGATITASTTVPEGMNLVLNTADRASKVAAFYQQELKAKGWTIETTMNIPTGNMVAARKGDRTTTAMVGRNDEATTVSLMIANK